MINTAPGLRNCGVLFTIQAFGGNIRGYERD
jgi:hypothetical protein